MKRKSLYTVYFSPQFPAQFLSAVHFERKKKKSGHLFTLSNKVKQMHFICTIEKKCFKGGKKNLGLNLCTLNKKKVKMKGKKPQSSPSLSQTRQSVVFFVRKRASLCARVCAIASIHTALWGLGQWRGLCFSSGCLCGCGLSGEAL